MNHVSLLLSIASLSTGIASITVAFLFYFQYKRKALLCYGLLLSVIALLTVSRAIPLYATIAGLSLTLHSNQWSWILQHGAYLLGVFCGPYFVHYLIGIPLTRIKKIVYTLVGASFLAVSSASFFLGATPASEILRVWIGLPILLSVYLYLLIYAALYLGQLGSARLNFALKVFFALSLAAMPLAFYQCISQKPYLPFFLETPLSFLAINILSLFFSFYYFNQPAYFENGTISDSFKKQFSATARECEIISMVIKGLSNCDIGEKLFISQRTVESHLYNIFQKTGVKNRIQLANLFQTNKKG